MPRRVLFLQTARDQIDRFQDAAMRLGVQLIPFDAAAPSNAAVGFARAEAVEGCVAADSRAAVAAAVVGAAIGVPWHPPSAVEVSCNKLLTRERLRDTDLLVPWFFPTSLTASATSLAAMTEFPCVLKPLVPCGGRGVIRADDAASFVRAFADLKAFLESDELAGESADDRGTALVEGYIDGWEFALEGVMHHGVFNAFALFDKPDPLEGPRFDDSLWVTPSLAPEAMQWDILDAVSRAITATGLRHGPVHAECRVGDRGVFVLGVTPRPLGGDWAGALRFQKDGKGTKIPYEELLLRHALGEAMDTWRRETDAAGARKTASGFVYATSATSEEVERALREQAE
jgi:biotin carboxylase